MNVIDGYMFEKYVAKIFEEAGYSVELEKRLEDRSGDIDIIAEKEAKRYCIEVKFSRIIDKAVERICTIAEAYNMLPVLVSAYVIEEKRKILYQKKYPKIIMIDVTNLLYAVKYSTELHNELVSMLPCYKLLKNAFSDDLALWREQQKSNKDLYRFDLLCRIKDGNQKTFWSILERYFNSKYVIFEFKNYSEKITQKEIYTTERYLYAKALRSVAIIVSANGYEENAYWAAKGSLRENGKLIMLFDTKDLIAMNKMKIEQEDPANYLLDRLDDLLLNLEK